MYLTGTPISPNNGMGTQNKQKLSHSWFISSGQTSGHFEQQEQMNIRKIIWNFSVEVINENGKAQKARKMVT
jgi:hypothetical protein